MLSVSPSFSSQISYEVFALLWNLPMLAYGEPYELLARNTSSALACLEDAGAIEKA